MSWYDNIGGEKSLTLPIIIDNEYFNKLNEYLDSYVKKLESINVEDNIIERVNEINKLIIDCIEKYFRGNIDESRINLKNVIRILENDNLLISKLNKSFALKGLTPFMKKDSCSKTDIPTIM